MRFYPRLGVYKASNFIYGPTNMEAYSYGWWRFLEKIGDRLVFNSYRYSQSTSGHQSKLRRLLGWDTKLTMVECPAGLQNLESAITHYRYKQDILNDEINKPRSQGFKNLERAAEIERLEREIELVRELIRTKESG